MNLLFDGCVPRPLRNFLTGHTIQTARENHWAELRNGDLLRTAEGRFDAFLTADQNLRYQHKLAGRRSAIPVLPSNLWPVLRLMTERIAAAVNRLRPGDYIEIAAN